jgi:hypothetical protein
MVAAAQTMVPWHCQPFLACSCDGIDGSSVDDSAQQQWPQSERWCLAGIVSLPFPACMMVTMEAAQRNGSRAEDCEALNKDK